MIELDGVIDPLSVTSRSVVVVREDGRPLSARLSTSGHRLQVELEVGPVLIAERPDAIHIRLAGHPSLHSVRTRDGRGLARAETVVFVVGRSLDALGRAGARLERVAGHALPLPEPLAVSGVLQLVFEGVLDPATIRPENCILLPKLGGPVLGTPIRPALDWRCVGSRFELELDLGDAVGGLQLDLRRFEIRDLSGARPEPPLVVELFAS